ncbi:hypothetical protein ACYSUO_16295 [Streptomyces sp. UC4497]
MPRPAPITAARAGLFSVMGTSVTFTVHHLAFDSSPSWIVRSFAALLLFVVALPGAGQDRSLRTQLMLAFGCQAIVGYWFVRADGAVSLPVHEAWSASLHAGWLVAIAHVVLTALGAVLLHGVDDCRRRMLVAAARRQWEALGSLLRRLFAPVCTPLDLDLPGAVWRVVPRPMRAPPSAAFLADVVVRRGPPSSPCSLAA